jgi:hypothetical protein
MYLVTTQQTYSTYYNFYRKITQLNYENIINDFALQKLEKLKNYN